MAKVVDLEWPALYASDGHPNGGSAVIWLEQSDNIGEVRLQIYRADGTKLGSSRLVAPIVRAGDPAIAAVDVAALNDGGWLVTWNASPDDGVSDAIFQQRYSASGKAIGEPVMVTELSTDARFKASVVDLIDGGWIVSWQAIDFEGNRQSWYQRFDAHGKKVGTQMQAGSAANVAETNLTIAALADGGWVANWGKRISAKEVAVFQQRYDADGHSVGGVVKAADISGSFSGVSNVGLEGGGWVTMWSSYSTSDTAAYLSAFDAKGKPLFSSPFKMGLSGKINSVEEVAITALSHGGWAVAWTNWSGSSVNVQVFDKAGNAQKIERVATPAQDTIQIAALDDGAFVVSWNTFDTGDAIQQIRFEGHNLAPSGKDALRKIAEDATYKFKASDFGFSDADGDVLSAIKITALPKKGALKIDGRTVKSGDIIEVSELAKLTWKPPADSSGEKMVKIGFQVIDDGGTFNGGVDTDRASNFLTFSVTEVVDVFQGNSKDNKLVGTSSADILQGKGGDDVLDGGRGADHMEGGSGNDTYYVDNVGDIVGRDSEYLGGFDSILSSVSYELHNEFIEKLVLTGHKNLNAVSDSKFIYGNSGKNTLEGRASSQIFGRDGDDRLISSARDKLHGGSGNDTFVKNFNNSAWADVLDFNPKGRNHDVIELTNTPDWLTFGKLKSSYMEQEGDDVIITNRKGYYILTLKDVELSDLDASDFLL